MSAVEHTVITQPGKCGHFPILLASCVSAAGWPEKWHQASNPSRKKWLHYWICKGQGVGCLSALQGLYITENSQQPPSVRVCSREWSAICCSSPPQHRSLFSVVNNSREQQKKILQINYCYCSHKEQKYKFLWLYCADSCAVPERFFQQQERRTDSLHKAIKADNPQEVIMWIPRRETKIEQRLIQPAIRISILPLSWRGWFILLMPGK